MATTTAELEARLSSAGSDADPTARIDALNDLAWSLRNVDLPRANKLAGEARELAIEHSYKRGRARAARTLAMTITEAAGLRSIFDLAHEAMDLFDELGDQPGRAGSRDFLASLYEFVGDLPGGMGYALAALDIARDLGDPVRQGYALANIGGIQAVTGDIDGGVERLQEALALFEGVRDPDGVGAICSRLCKVLKQAGRIAEALEAAERCRDLAHTTDNEFLHWRALSVMGEIEQDRGNASEAERLYRDAIQSWRTEVGRNVMATETQLALARLLIQRGAYAEAEHELRDALTRAEGNFVLIAIAAEAHEALADLQEQQGRFTATIHHLRNGKRLREKIAQREANAKLAQVEVRATMESAKRDAEIHRLRFVELQAMQAKLVEAEKMALLGRLAAGTAHELNSPLGVLRSNVSLTDTARKRLLSLLPGERAAAAELDKLAAVFDSCAKTSAQAIDRIADISDSFRRFSDLDHAERHAYDVLGGLESLLTILAPTLSREIRIERRLQPVPQLDAWPRELNHAFLTVLQNAAQAIDGEGVIEVETSATDDHVLVRIRDSGRGMTEQQAAQLFDVGMSDSGPRTKMRLGLSAAYATMQKHGGTIEVSSELGKGTTVTFRFPQPST